MPNEISSSESNIPNDKIIKAVVAFEELGDDEKGAFLSEINKASGGISDRLKLFLTKTKSRLNSILHKKKGFTEIKLSGDKAHEIINDEIESTNQINLTIVSSAEFPDEIALQKIELAKALAKEFGIYESEFIDILHEFHTDFHYYLLTDEPIDLGIFLPDGCKFEDYGSSKIQTAYDSQMMYNVSQEEIDKVYNKLQEILEKHFLLRDESRIKAFIDKTRLTGLIVGYRGIMRMHNMKSH